jgi:hypothetical protein
VADAEAEAADLGIKAKAEETATEIEAVINLEAKEGKGEILLVLTLGKEEATKEKVISFS